MPAATTQETKVMNWLARAMLADWDQAIRNDVANVKAGVTELRMQQAEIMKTLTAINQSVAKLLIKHSQDPQELTNEERAALLGLPPSMAELVDWDQMRRT